MIEGSQLLNFLSGSKKVCRLQIPYAPKEIGHNRDELSVLYATTETKRVYYKSWFSRKRKWENKEVVTKEEWLPLTEAIKTELPKNAKILQIKLGYRKALIYYAI